ncbi:MAG: hypothetical protein F6K31_17595 [Symploca sp. SIO2G7]|nr:hypothetical protein [Symploca sp. SIO2G7]
MPEQTFYIHQFSVVLPVERTEDGSWIPGRFTGEYTNSTITRIPDSIYSAIDKGEFSLTARGSLQTPAVIGRVITAQGVSWSVVAIITSFLDPENILFAAYRYFLCQGEHSLGGIIGWIIDEHQQRYGKLPVFKPGETRQPRAFIQHIVSTEPKSNLETRDWEQINNTSIPVLIRPEKPYELYDINEIASRKANQQPVAWAFQVESLKDPQQFQVIQVTSSQAYRRLQQTVKSGSSETITAIAEEVYDLLREDILKLIREEVQTQLNSLQNTTNPPGRQIEYTGRSSRSNIVGFEGSLRATPVIIAATTEQDLITIYNQDPTQLLERVNKVSLKQTDSTNQSEPIRIEMSRNGNYWLIFDQEPNGWLTPKMKLIIDPYCYETIKTIFTCEGYQIDGSREFTLVAPARVVTLPGGREWGLIEPGKLIFA